MNLKYKFNVPPQKKIRLIINSDAKNEADDQFAIVHAVLTPLFQIEGIIAAHYGTERDLDSMEKSYREIKHVLDLMTCDDIPVVRGATRGLTDEQTAEMSEGSSLIIKEALKDDPRPLFVVFLGPITDLASAYLQNPDISGRLTAIWIGGGAWPHGADEFNLSNDIHAVNVVFKANLELWQVPKPAYSGIRVSIAELQHKVQPYGEIGNYLFQQLVELNEKLTSGRWPFGESWSMGDSPAISLLLDAHRFDYQMRPAPLVTNDMNYIHYQQERQIRVYDYIDARYTLEDMYAKLAINFPNE
ncbi:nucleoside hydrolase [Bacillus solitudinis]|uniref:nucleoside hydrolase n=1 Tax=Bacillus solitudinis TaxID=2014074 RepID=UPI000C23AC13|nr:nucleoside hydrolase [Bacillus solitudinis]